MRKIFLATRLYLFLLAILPPAGLAFSAPQVPPAGFVGVCSAIVYDMDNDAILFEQNAEERIPPASLTKVMSMFLALDFIRDGHAKLDTPVSIGRQAAATGGSRMGLRQGESVTLGKLLYGMAVSSGNDASFATAEFVGGSAANFVKMMNARAKTLGMLDSNFENPHGLPAAGQYTTARDMLTLARAYLKAHPQALEMHNTKTIEHDGYTSWNKNPLLGQYPGADGLKTGWIRASGYNLIFTAARGEKRILAVILGAPDIYIRGAEACRLLDAGFLVCENSEVSVAAALDRLPVDLARIDPRKTGREAGLIRARHGSGTKITRTGRYGGRHIRQADKARPRKAAARKRTLAIEKARARHRDHAEKRLPAPRSRRS